MASSSTFQSYKLLENGEDPAADPSENGDIDPQYSKSQRKFLESVQSFKSFVDYVQERIGSGRQVGGKKRSSGFCGWRNGCFIFAAVLAVAVIVVIVGSAFTGFAEVAKEYLGAFGGEAKEDVLQYIDPLIGTGPGGTSCDQHRSR
jgi:hypothetical protein